jgi:hypothetical protein
MKFSKKTIKSIAYLATIHPSILFRTGNTQWSRNEAKTILTKVTIDEPLPIDFVIYDINNFLRVVDLFTDPEIDFVGDKESGHLVLSENGAKIRYKFSSPALHGNVAPNVDYVHKGVKWEMDVELSEDEIENILTVTKVMNLDTISFRKDGIKLLKTDSSRNIVGVDEFAYFEIPYQTKPEISSDIGGDDFYINLKTQTFLLHKGSYKVKFLCGSPTVAKFTRVENDVVVWVGSSDAKI